MTASTQPDRDDAHDKTAAANDAMRTTTAERERSEWELTRMAVCGRHHRRAVRVDEGARGSLAQRNLSNGRSYTTK